MSKKRCSAADRPNDEEIACVCALVRRWLTAPASLNAAMTLSRRGGSVRVKVETTGSARDYMSDDERNRLLAKGSA
jgi:hypothetical protein